MNDLMKLPLKEWVWPIVLLLGLLALVGIVASDDAVDGRVLPAVADLLWVGVLFLWFVHCFTGDPYQKRTMSLVFSFFFMTFAFGVVSVMIIDVANVKRFGVVEGCVESFDANAHTPIQCNYPPSTEEPAAGNSGVRQDVADARPAVNPPSPPALDKSRYGAAPQTRPRRDRTAIPGDSSASASSSSSSGTASGTASQPETCGSTASEKLLCGYRQKANYHYLVNIGGHLTPLASVPRMAASASAPGKVPTSTTIFAIRGGLPVPLYFVLIALMGGAISLAKNLPGIQKRSDDAWVGTPQDSRLSAGATRELLLFQVLQFISAPILAVVAFHTIKPESMASGVMLAFTAGFASDVVLDQMRKLSNGSGSTPATPAPHLATAIRGVVTQGGSPVAGATVAILHSNIPPATTAADGSYTLIAVPVSPHPLAIQASEGNRASLPATITVATQAQAVVNLQFE